MKDANQEKQHSADECQENYPIYFLAMVLIHDATQQKEFKTIALKVFGLKWMSCNEKVLPE